MAPTDAALGLPIFTNPNVPVRIRRALNVESGLNDGLATPFVTLFIALAVAEEGATPVSGWLVGALTQVAVAVIVGVAVGVVGGKLLIAHRRKWTYWRAAAICGSGARFDGVPGLGRARRERLLAAFVAGLPLGRSAQPARGKRRVHRNDRHLLSLLVWTIFGAVFIVPAALKLFEWRVVGYALLSLTDSYAARGPCLCWGCGSGGIPFA